jgi:prepilin-type N-terminal cleavage/methylation domain-containing protein
MLRRAAPSLGRARGFSLIELMVALVVGLIVIGAVLALIMSIIRSNNQTVLATRLTQEMRATMAVIAGDIRRARGVDDPFSMTAPGANPFARVFSDTPGCLRYSYAGATGGNFHTISIDANGTVRLNAAAAEPACATGQSLSSAFVTINVLTFTPLGVPPGGDLNLARRYQVTLQGSLTSNPGIQRTLTQTVFTRSIAGN